MGSANVVIVVVLWAVTLWRLPAAWWAPWKRAAWVSLAALATAMTVDLPAVITWVDQAAGVTDLATLIKHLAGIIACTAILDWVIALNRHGPGRRSFGRWHAAAAATMMVMILLFVLVPRRESAEFTDTQTGGAATAYLVVFHAYLGAAMVAAARLFWRASRGTRPGALRWGLWLLACGTTAGAAYAACQVVLVIIRFAGLLGRGAAGSALTASASLENLAIALILIGTSVPAVGVAGRMIAEYRSLRALRPLRDSLVTAAPEIAAGPWPPGGTHVRALREPHLRLIWRTAEIRDSSLVLRRYAGDDAVDRAHVLLAARGLGGQRLEAAAEACWLELAMHAKRDGEQAAHPSLHALPGGSDLAGEVAWLRLVASARRSAAVRAVCAELGAGVTAADTR